MLHVAAGVYFNGYSGWWVVLCVLAYIALLVLGSIFISWNFYLKSVNKVPLVRIVFEGGQMQLKQRGKQIALTFDDGPAAYTEQVLDILKKEQLTATFFLIGKNIAGKEHLVQRMLSDGHSIGNHSYEHGFHFDWQSAQKMADEIQRTNDTIEAITGAAPVLFRPPYGVTNPNLAKAVSMTDMKSIGWSLRSMDTKARDEGKLLQSITGKLKSGDIILLHDRCAITAAILPQLIGEIKKRGFECTTLS